MTLVLDLSVAVTLSNDSLADLPLEERCLTAKVVRAVPWFEFVPSKRENDTATVCLGEDPKVLMSSGETDLFDYLDCVGETSTPCTSADTLELVVRAEQAKIALPGLDRVDIFSRTAGVNTWLQPEDVVVHIQDPQGAVWREVEDRQDGTP